MLITLISISGRFFIGIYFGYCVQGTKIIAYDYNLLYHLRYSLYDIGALQFAQLLVAAIEVSIDGYAFWVGAILVFESGRHGTLGMANVGMYTCHDGSTHRSTQRASLFGLHGLDGPIQYVRQCLHHVRRFLANPARGDDFPHRDTLGLEAVYNGFRTECCRFNQCFKQPWRIGT